MAAGVGVERCTQQLVATFPLREPMLQAAAETLAFAAGTRGLDVGCGVALQTMLLAKSVGPAGPITGVDVEPRFVDHGRRNIEAEGLADAIVLREGNADELPFDDNSFDWSWSVDCVGYGPCSPAVQLREMARVVRPGGTVAIVAWSSEKLLPGYPVLEARLQATSAGLAPFARGMPPGRHLPRALGLLREAGLVELRAHTFAGTAHAPLSPDLRRALSLLFEMRWPGATEQLEPEDSAEFERLCRPGASEFILDHPDYYAFFTYSMFLGRVAQ